MTWVSFAAIGKSAFPEKLYMAVRCYFPCPENDAYLSDIMSRKNAESKAESLASLELLGKLLKKYSIVTDSLVLKRSPDGKPYFEGSPLHFSLSHSNGYVAAAISDTCEVGIDIECSDIPPEKAKKLAKRYFAEDEAALCEASPERFSEIWTRKEAFAKMRGGTLAEALLRSKKDDRYMQNAFCRSFEIDNFPVTVCLEKETEAISLAELLLDNDL